MRHIGIYSGTFDPIHEGHIAFAKKACDICNLDKVVFLPEPQPRNKTNVTEIRHRIEIIKKVIKGDDSLDIAVVDSTRFTPGTTMSQLEELFPDTQFTFLFGSDVIKNLNWPGIENLLSKSNLAIGLRHNDTKRSIITIVENLKRTYHVKFNYFVVKTEKSGVTSSHIRQGFKSIAGLRSDVNTYISENKLYKS